MRKQCETIEIVSFIIIIFIIILLDKFEAFELLSETGCGYKKGTGL